MIDIDALAQSGLSNERLKEIFTAEPPDPPKNVKRSKPVPLDEKGADEDVDVRGTLNSLERLPKNPTDWDVRCYLETIIQGEQNEGQMRCAENFDRIGAMDLAYTSIPIHPVVPPLMQVAMGYISMDQCQENIAKLSACHRDNLFEKDSKGKVTGVKSPKLLEVSHNLVHSLVTRRRAALSTEIHQQYPLLQYEPFSNSQTGRLGGDVMTQLAEQMAGAYGYRHDYSEAILHASLYTDCIKFKKSAWHVEKQKLPVRPPMNGAVDAGRPAKKTFEDKIVREGVLFDIPHPTRTYYDISRRLSKLNQDLGPRWLGHWEAVPIGDIRNNEDYWNRDEIVMDAGIYSMFTGNPAYFAQYYDRISLPDDKFMAGMSASLLALKNDRVAQIGKWAELHDETATILCQHYKQVIPKKVGLGKYPFPVWLRFVTVGNKTVIFSEIVGSAPASVATYNGADNLLNSPSFGSQAIQWQQMLTNSLTELMHVQAQGLVRIYALNTHGMKKGEIETVVNALKNPDFSYLKDIIIEYDAEKLGHRGADIRTITEKITQIRIETGQKITEIFNGMMNTLALCERLMFFSPQELGQTAPRTTSATEQKAVQATTLGIRDYHLVGAKEMMDADKRIINDSYQAFGSDELEVPVAERYEPAVIKAAGFEIVDDGSGNPPDGLYTIKGKKWSLYYNYTYTTRQTDDTPPDAARAQGIAQIYDVVNKDPIISAKMNLEQRYELANSLFDIIAPGIFKLRVAPGQDGKETQAGQVEQMQQQLQQILPQLGQQLQQLAQKQAETDAKIAQTDAGLKALTQATQRLTGVIEQTAKRNGNGASRPTMRGQISPENPVGVGAPPLRGVRPIPVVPAVGPTVMPGIPGQ